MGAEKQRRLLAKNLDDADEFLARNLVDTRYVTRLFANMLRERVLFGGGATEEELTDILPDDDGTTRWNRYQHARVRTPQGRLVDFLRGKWGLAHAKDREKSDLHHALDACIIAAGQRAEHYEMAAYGTLVAWARAMGHDEAADLLQETLDEEKAADETLTAIAEGGVNDEAAQMAHPDEEENGDDDTAASPRASGGLQAAAKSAGKSARKTAARR